MKNVLSALNTATKYPSIETYHKLDGGTLTQERNFEFEGTVILTEKVDGTNSRIIRLPDGDYIIGSRNELLYAKGDRIGSPVDGVADHLRPIADRLNTKHTNEEWIEVFYLETYGGRIGAQARQYSGKGSVGHQLFDVALVPVEVLAWPLEKISSWRNGGGQKFLTEPALQRAGVQENLPVAPRLGTVAADALPLDLVTMENWLRVALPCTNAALDDAGGAKAEGMVLRTYDRRTIAKARFADYARALNPQPKKGRR
jgi:hypothetical protein